MNYHTLQKFKYVVIVNKLRTPDFLVDYSACKLSQSLKDAQLFTRKEAQNMCDKIIAGGDNAWIKRVKLTYYLSSIETCRPHIYASM